MFARVSTYQGDADGLVDGFNSQTDALRQVEGFKYGLFLVDREGGKAMSITLWASAEARDASADRANEMREAATEPSGASIGDVDNYEVAITVN
jgi:hypothetical protein